MRFVVGLLFFFCTPLFAGKIPTTEKPIVVVIPSYNNIEWYKKNLASVFQQRYNNYRVIYIDDCSQDGTFAAVREYVHATHQEHRCTLIHNTQHLGAMANWYHAIHSTDDDEIIVCLDGDDHLFHRRVLQHLNTLYSTRPIWYTHGGLIEYPGRRCHWNKPIPPEVIASHSYRKFACPSHLRTFYSWLFKRIDKERFFFENSFFPITCDMAIMFPIAEMAGERHAFIEDIVYVYNCSNPINDNKVNPELQNLVEQFIRNAQPCERLKER